MTLFSLVVRGFEACFLAVRFLVGSHGGGGNGGGVHPCVGCALNGAEMFC